MILQAVHLPIPLGAACAHGTCERPVTLLCLRHRQAHVCRAVYGKVALPTISFTSEKLVVLTPFVDDIAIRWTACMPCCIPG